MTDAWKDRALRAAVLCAAVGAALVPAAADRAAADAGQDRARDAVGCDDVPGRTVLANREVRVLRRVTDHRGRRTFACHRRSGRSTWLGDEDVVTFTTDIALLRLSGRFVAYIEAGGGREGPGGFGLRRLDTRTGDLETFPPGFVPAGRLGILDDLPGLLVTRQGQVAWIARTSFEPRRYAVRALRGGETVTLEESGAIDPASLAAAGERIYWTSDGQPRSG